MLVVTDNIQTQVQKSWDIMSNLNNNVMIYKPFLT